MQGCKYLYCDSNYNIEKYICVFIVLDENKIFFNLYFKYVCINMLYNQPVWYVHGYYRP